MKNILLLFLLVILLPVWPLCSAWAAGIVAVDEKDMVKDTDIFNDVIVNEQAVKMEEDIGNTGPIPKVEVIIDSSGSMGQILSKNKSKMYYLKELMKPFFRSRWKEKNNIGLRVYGGIKKATCQDDHLVVPFGDRNLGEMEKKLMKLDPQGLTPLHKSMLSSFEDMKSFKGPKRVVIVTDGQDTCGGDPCKTAEELAKQQLDLQFFVIALGFKGESTSLAKVKCIGDTAVADSEESLEDALGQVGSKISNRQNFQVISPNPDAPVYLFEILPDGKKVLNRVFYANSQQTVPPGKYEAVVGLDPLYKFTEFIIPPRKKVTLKVAGDGTIKVNFFNSLIYAEVLDKNNKVVKRFKSEQPVEIPTGKWRVRVFRDPFFEITYPDFFIYPKGKHEFDIHGVGVVRIDHPELQGLYVYDMDNKLLGQHLTQAPTILKSGVYSLHVNEDCSFPKIQVFDRKEILVYPCGGK